MECQNLAKCGFVKCCEGMQKGDSVKGFIRMYCQGDKQSTCIRFQLSSKFGKEAVPPNMMPNGFPLPGTTKDGWSSYALNYQRYLSQ